MNRLSDDIINGKYGNGEARRRNLERAGYNYEACQNMVNQRLGYSKRRNDDYGNTWYYDKYY